MTSNGITCVHLKYRVPESGPHGDGKRQINPKAPMALQDARRTMGLIRFHATEYHIGVLGLSAGGMSTHFDRRLYPAIDPAGQKSCRSDFYPGHLWFTTSR